MMNGVEVYDKECLDNINARIENSSNSKLLKAYYNYTVSATKTKSLRTRYNYVCHVDMFLNEIEKEVADITFQDLVGYMAEKEYKKDGTKYSQSHKIGVYTALKHLFDFLCKTNEIKENPMNNINRPTAYDSQETIKKRDNNYLDRNEIKMYIDTLKRGAGNYIARAKQENWKERDMLIIMLFLKTGIRRSALRKLDVDSIDLENKTLTVTDKGEKSKIRAISDDVVELARKWLIKREELLDGKKEVALFISNRKTRISANAISNLTDKYSTYIDGKKITPHKLRATYGTQLYNETKDIVFVQGMMGHNSPKTTELYVRGNSENELKAIDIMNNVCGGF